MKKQYLIYILIFIIGIFTGGYMYGVSSIKNMQMQIDANKEECKITLEDSAYQAYREEDPKVTIWALQNLINSLHKQKESIFYTQDNISTLLMLSHVRLALMYKKLKSIDKYQKNILIALSIIDKQFHNEVHTENDLLRYVKILDKNNEIYNKPYEL